MKRSVAIVGPTPMFLRWAIEHHCPLREIYPERLAESTFRQLRGLREVSLALSQTRVHEGYRLHPDSMNSDPGQLSGFSVDEAVGIFGGQKFIDRQCSACPANIGIENPTKHWCGCYGGVSTDLRIDFQGLVRGEYRKEEGHTAVLEPVEGTIQRTSKWWDLPGLIDRMVHDSDLQREIGKHFPPSRSAWFALWQADGFDSEKLSIIEVLLGRAIEFLQQEIDSDRGKQSKSGLVVSEDLKRFRFAIMRVLESREKIVVELVPSGYSDGRTWQIDPHCKSCRQIWRDRARHCSECGERGQYQNEIKLKVLGLRPYVQLAQVIGVRGAEKLIESYRSQIAEE